MTLFKYPRGQICLGPFRPMIRSLPALVCSSVTILTSPTNLSEKKSTSILLWIVTLKRPHFTCILVLLRDCHLGLQIVMGPLSILRGTDGWVPLDTREIMSDGGKYDALGEITVHCSIIHCTVQANCPVFKPSTSWWGWILQKTGNLGGSVLQHSDFQTVVRALVLARRFFMPVLEVCSHYSFNLI